MFLSGTATAGPFGLDDETFQLDQFQCGDEVSGFYTCLSVPKPHPDIETYIVQFVDGVGLCMIKGISKNIPDSIYGDGTRRKVDEIYDQLSSKYGKGDKLDFLRPGSIWNEPEDWTMGLLKDERTYAALWDLPSPVDGVADIALAAKAVNREASYFIVEFHKDNTDECDIAQSTKAADSF
jgi:hypothetical protein